VNAKRLVIYNKEGKRVYRYVIDEKDGIGTDVEGGVSAGRETEVNGEKESMMPHHFPSFFPPSLT
jgi:hypothetical protein